MVEIDHIRSNNNKRMLKDKTERAWDHVKVTFGIQDSFDYTTRTISTLGNNGVDGARNLSTLDMF